MLDLINENYSLLLLLQHFNIDFAVNNKTVEELCHENKISLPAFIIIGNMYNGFYPEEKDVSQINHISSVLTFLKNSHKFYIEDKYPELKLYIEKLRQKQSGKDFQLIESFFNDYFDEVLEHLKYEEKTAFPYFLSLFDNTEKVKSNTFSANEYRHHHTDIETKLTDLKNLFLKHIKIKNNANLKRKFLNTLFELEFDLTIHSIIEEKILIPMAEKIEAE